MMNRLASFSNLLLILFFLLGLIYLGWRNTTQLLEAKPATLEELRLDDFKNSVQQFSSAFETQAGKDAQLLAPLAQAKYAVFNNALTRKIIPGKEGWLFLWEETEQIDGMKQVLGKVKLNPIELKQWRVYTNQRSTFLAAQGIPYYKIIAPNKASVYPEYLPEGLMPATTNFTDQLLEDLQQHTEVAWIDLRPILRSYKTRGQLYYKTDTHWNNLGAFCAAEHILEELTKAGFPVKPLRQADFNWKTIDKKGGDAARLMMMPEELRQNYIDFEPVGDLSFTNQDSLNQRFAYLSPFITASAKGELPKTILFHDSFATNLRLFLAYHFQQLYSFWLWGAFDEAVVTQEKPALVLDEVVERRLVETQHKNSANLLNWYWERQFPGLKTLTFDAGKIKSLEDLAIHFSKMNFPADQLLIVKLELECQKDQKVSFGDAQVMVPYFLTNGRQEIYLQLDPTQPLLIKENKADLPRLLDVQLKLY
ncbi:MAG: hypothetical protein AB8G15_13110 [Saprospiraceae bacterium]